MIGNQKNC